MKDLENIIKEIIDKYDLDYGNSDVDLETGRFYIEAPNNWIITVVIPENDMGFYINSKVDKEQKVRALLEQINHACIAADPEDKFRDMWSPQAPISPFYLMDCLRDDKKFFMNVATKAFADSLKN